MKKLLIILGSLFTLLVIGIFVITGHQFSAPMVAAILCIAGYSINDTIVVFDTHWLVNANYHINCAASTPSAPRSPAQRSPSTMSASLL